MVFGSKIKTMSECLKSSTSNEVMKSIPLRISLNLNFLAICSGFNIGLINLRRRGIGMDWPESSSGLRVKTMQSRYQKWKRWGIPIRWSRKRSQKICGGKVPSYVVTRCSESLRERRIPFSSDEEKKMWQRVLHGARTLIQSYASVCIRKQSPRVAKTKRFKKV